MTPSLMLKIKRGLDNPLSVINHVQNYFDLLVADNFWAFIAKISRKGQVMSVRTLDIPNTNAIDNYWTGHTVYVQTFRSAHQSKKYISKRFHAHPLFLELSGLYGIHDDEIILDYGCGPGNDVTGFAIFTNAKKIIGMDVSVKVLLHAAHRLALHNIDPEKIELVQISDNIPIIPLPDYYLDFINCQGVLMHTSCPEKILTEFFRVLKPDSKAVIMVYIKDSIWFHLYTAYEKMIIEGKYFGSDITTAFSKNTDGEDCPMARCYSPQEFISLCQSAGFQCEFVGGYFTEIELHCIKNYYCDAISDQRLGIEQKEFLQSLVFDNSGYPRYNGYYAGVSGVFHLSK